jgi:hypothetical protein
MANEQNPQAATQQSSFLAELDAELNGAPPPGGAPTSSFADELDAELRPEAPQSQSNRVLQGSINFWDYTRAKYKITEEDIRRGWIGDQLMGSGGEGYEEAIKPSAEETEAAEVIAEYRKQNDLDNNHILNFLTEAGAGGASMIPFMGEMAKGGLAGGTGGALVGGGITLATGGAGAVSIPALAANGARLGAGTAIGRIMAGKSYLEMRQKGIAHDKAATMATVNGIAQGSLAIAQFGNAAKATGEAAKVQLGHWSKMATQFLEQQAKAVPHVAIAAGQNGAGAVVDHMAQGIAAILDSQPEASPMSLGSAAAAFGQSFAESLAPMTGLITTGKTLGFGAGAATRLARLNAARATRQIRTKKKELDGRISALEKEFEAEEAARQEQELIDEINKVAEELAAEQVKERELEAAQRQAQKQPSKSAQQKQKVEAKKESKAAAAEREVRRIIDATKSKFRIERGETVRQEIGRVQKVLKDLVKNSSLDDNMQKRLLGRVLNVDSVSDLVKEAEKFIADIKERELRNEQKAALGKVEKSVDFDAVEDGKSRFAKSISEEFQQPTIDAFNAYKEFVRDELAAGTKEYQGKAEQALADYHDAVANSKDPTPFEARARIAAQVWGLKEKAPETLSGLAESIEKLKQEGLTAGEKQKLKEQIRQRAIRQTMLEELQKGKEVPVDLTQADPEALQRLYDKYGHLPSTVAGEIFSWNGLMKWLTIYSDNPSAFLALMDVHKPTQRVTTAVRNATTFYHEVLAKHSPDGTLGGATKLILAGAKPEKIGEYEKHPLYLEGHLKEKAGASLNLSPNQAVKLYLQLQDRSLDTSRIHGNGYTLKGEVAEGLSTQELLEDYFSDPQRKPYLDLAKGLREFFDGNFGRVSDATWDQFGVRPEKNKDYSGYAAHDGDKLESEADFATNWNQHISRTIQPSRAGMTIDRVKTAKPLAVRDAFTEVYQQIAMFEHWNEWRKSNVPLSAVFEDQQIRNVIKQKFGENFLKSIDTFRRDLVWGPQLRAEGLGAWLNAALKQYADVVLLARPGQFFKQLTGFTATLQRVAPSAISDGIRDFFKDPERNWARLSRREYFKNRFDSIMQQHMGALIAQGFEDPKVTKFREYAGLAVKYGDKVSSALTAHIIYKAAVDGKLLGHEGKMTEAQALLTAEKFVNETQSSGTINELSNMARNPYLKAFTLLAQQPTRRLEEIILDVSRARQHPTAENKAQAMRTINGAGVSAMAFSGMGAALTTINPLASDDQRKDAWTSFAFSYFDPVFGAPIAGPGAKYATNDVLNKVFGADIRLFEQRTSVDRALQATYEIPGDVAGLVGDPSLSSVSTLTQDYLLGPNVLIPGKYSVPTLKGGTVTVPTGLPLLELQKAFQGIAK